MKKYRRIGIHVEADGETVTLQEGDIPLTHYGTIVTILRPINEVKKKC